MIFRLYPDDEADLEKIEKAVSQIKAGEFRETKRMPIAFGLELLRAAFIIPDKTEGAMENLEQAVRSVKGVKEVEVDGVTLL